MEWGIPIEVSCRLRPRLAGAIGAGDAKVVDGNTVQLLKESGAPGLAEDVYKAGDASRACIFGAETRQKDLYASTVENLVHGFCDGINHNVVGFGQSDAGKTHTLVGQEGMLQQSCQSYFGIMQGKQQDEDRRGGSMKTELHLQIFEIFEEEIRDLLVPNSPPLELQMTPKDGPVVMGLTSKRIDEPQQIQQALDRVNSIRVPHVSDFGPGTHFTTTFYTLHLTQTYEYRGRELKSRLTFIDLPGAEKLSEDPETLLVTQGTYLNKSILALGRVIQELSTPDGSDFVDFKQCMLTQLMEDALVGNSKTMFMVVLASWDYKNSKSVMAFSKMIEQLRTYPITNSTHANGLLCKYRKDLLRVGKDLQAAQAAAEKQETRHLLLKINDLEGSKLTESTARIKLFQEKEQLYEKVVQFREKYNKLVESKASVQQKLIESEEERLTISKALIDVEIEKSNEFERAESKRYDVMQKLLDAENEVMQLTTKDEEMTKHNRELKIDFDKIAEEKKQLAMELVAVKESYSEMKEKLQNLGKKKDDVSLEMVNLINAKKDLKRKETELTQANETKAEEIKKFRAELAEMERVLGDRDQEITMLKHTTGDLKQDLHRVQFELDTKTHHFEADKLDIEKNYIAHTRDKDAETFILKEKFDAERTKMEEERVDIEQMNKVQERELRNETQRRMLSESECQEKIEIEKALKQEVDDLTRQKLELGDEYRNQIRENMEKVADLTKAFEGQGTTGGKQGALRAEIDRMMQSLILSYSAKEDELKLDKERYKSKVEDLVARNQRLHSAHRRCREQLLELAPRGSTPQVEDVSALVTNGQAEMDEDIMNDNRALQRRLQGTEEKLHAAQHEQVTLNASYMETITEMRQASEATVAELQVLKGENAALRGEKKIYEMSMLDGGETQKRMFKLQQEALDTIQEIKEDGIQVKKPEVKEGLIEAGDVENMVEKRMVAALTEEKAQHMSMITRLNNDLAVAAADQMELRRVRGERETLMAQLDVITGSDNTRQQLSAMVVQLKAKLKELESGESGSGNGWGGGNMTSVQNEMREFTLGAQKTLEAERAKLKMQCTMAEEKLRCMEEYMSTTIGQYQNQIMELKGQLQRYTHAR